jgi:hypothetical protein
MAFKDILLTQANYPGPTVLAVTARNLRAAFDAAATKAGLLHDPVSRNARPSPYRTYWSIELRDLTIVPGIGERRGVRDIRIAPVCSVSARTSARFRLNLEPLQGLGLSSTAARAVADALLLIKKARTSKWRWMRSMAVDASNYGRYATRDIEGN